MLLVLLAILQINSVPAHYREYFERADTARRRSCDYHQAQLDALPHNATEAREAAIRNLRHSETVTPRMVLPTPLAINHIGTLHDCTITHIIDANTMTVTFRNHTVIVTQTPTSRLTVNAKFSPNNEWIVVSNHYDNTNIPAGQKYFVVQPINQTEFEKLRDRYHATTIPPIYIPQNINNYLAASYEGKDEAIRDSEQRLSNLEIDLRSEPNGKEQTRLKKKIAAEQKALDNLRKEPFQPIISFQPFEPHALGRLPPCTVDTVINATTAIVKDSSSRAYVITKTQTKGLKRDQAFDKRTLWQTATPLKTQDATILQRLAGRNHIVVEPFDDTRIESVRDAFEERRQPPLKN